MPSHTSLKRLYNLYNRKWFNGELPHDVSIIWAPLDTAHGKCYPKDRVIIMDPPLQSNGRFLRIILLHEMVHMRVPRATHGKRFQSEIDRLFAAGAYRGLL